MKNSLSLIVLISLVLFSCSSTYTPAGPAPAQDISVKYDEYFCLMPYDNLTSVYDKTGGVYSRIQTYSLAGVTQTSTTVITQSVFEEKVYATVRVAAAGNLVTTTAAVLNTLTGVVIPPTAVKFWKSANDVEVLCANANDIIVYYSEAGSRDNTYVPGMPYVTDMCRGYTLAP